MVLSLPCLCHCVADFPAETTASERVTEYNNLVTKIESLGLDVLLSAKPLLNVRSSCSTRKAADTNSSLSRGRKSLLPLD